ncbi:polysaccharide biosynthesis tyrosine autokinase [Desulforhopalus sp. IMCC35007]|uniref:polysaccharide biosynthesis tyrosine autokinase n=1 Tax=Desulforhopalus sp. IMCC35007 TaxID=2569543 RepID=UPI0010AED1B5|nr:polysaccharide biosynthesis tyrosine autokinase [Desulforhopalus sp. IMCC35007]TKB12075.1 polysaccharide biosynthesis tyrosine autokinase [Desulforhopalus sp. IMCC35007]
MGKFSKTLEKANQHKNVQNNAESWLEPETVNLPTASITDTLTAGTSLSSDSPVGKWDERLFKAINEDSAIPEIFKLLRSKILHPKAGSKNIKTVMVTSAVPREGKSFITANLGISLAQGLDQHSLLVDCDLRKPTLSRLLGLNQMYGLVDYLKEDMDLPELITKTSMNKLSILPSGRPPLNPSELLSSSRMKDLVTELSRRYDDRIIIFDSPPVMVAAESGVLAGLVDTIILVVREGLAQKTEIQKTIDAIGKDKILGLVYNDQTEHFLNKVYSTSYGYYQHTEADNH